MSLRRRAPPRPFEVDSPRSSTTSQKIFHSGGYVPPTIERPPAVTVHPITLRFSTAELERHFRVHQWKYYWWIGVIVAVLQAIVQLCLIVVPQGHAVRGWKHFSIDSRILTGTCNLVFVVGTFFAMKHFVAPERAVVLLPVINASSNALRYVLFYLLSSQHAGHAGSMMSVGRFITFASLCALNNVPANVLSWPFKVRVWIPLAPCIALSAAPQFSVLSKAEESLIIIAAHVLGEVLSYAQQRTLRHAYLLQDSLRRKEADLQRRRSYEHDLMAITFHELRNPLNGVKGHLDLAESHLNQKLDPAELFALLPVLHKNVTVANVCLDHALLFLRRLSSLHQNNAGKLVAHPRPCELRRDVFQAVERIVRLQMHANVELRVEIVPPLAEVYVVADDVMLTQALLNIVQNAARFTTRGHVLLRCDIVEAATAENLEGSAGCADLRLLDVRLLVEDTGIGMTDEVQRKLCHRYESDGGIGLGMFLTSQLVCLLGGTMSAQSPYTVEHSGSRFTICLQLPACAKDRIPEKAAPAGSGECVAPLKGSVGDTPLPNATEDSTPMPVPTFRRGLSVLIADDIKLNRTLLKHAFRCHFDGAFTTIIDVATAEEALEAACRTAFDLIVMDENFEPPGRSRQSLMRGHEAVRRLREMESSNLRAASRPIVPRIAIICSTGNASTPGVNVALLNSGADGVWDKPFPCATNGSMQRSLAALAPQLLYAAAG